MTSFTNPFEEKEVDEISAEFIISREMSHHSSSIINSICDSHRKMRGYYGIHEAHSRGVGCEEIAQYLDQTVEYVQDCVALVAQLEYSKRTGNAIICKIPQE